MNRFGVREVADVTFKPLKSVDIGGQHFDAFQPVLTLDTAKTSSLEQAVTTVYANGGKGNPTLVSWDGEKKLTLNVQDALMSPVSFSVLSGAGVVKGRTPAGQDKKGKPIYVHSTFDAPIEKVGAEYVVKLSVADRKGAKIVVSKEAPIYPVVLDSAGAQSRFLSAVTDKEVKVVNATAPAGTPGTITLKLAEFNDDCTIKDVADKDVYFVLGKETPGDDRLDANLTVGSVVRLDCYTLHYEDAMEMTIEAKNFGGYYYIEASTLFRDEATGEDLPAEFIIPRGKIESNFTFQMNNSGDPSAFDFKIDCMPAYTKFDKSKKVLATLQVIDTAAGGHDYTDEAVLGHKGRTKDEEAAGWYSKSIFGA